ncbi:MAG: sulfatase-like hydrolase/transferase [Clostridiales bacterium]|nr:sulfatase-like hydrolase/transferase [Clostridiales bacterium]
MDKKVILISIDGMRPDGALSCGNPFVNEMMKRGSFTLDARTVYPSVTLPCHMSMFYSVPPERHGITTNLYMPPVRPFNGLFEQITLFGGKCAMYYGWEPLRDVSRPKSLLTSAYISARGADDTDTYLCGCALECINNHSPDFVFLYMVETDEKGGHDHGWMSQEYLDVMSNAVNCAKRVYETVGDKYTVIVTSDHGGHDRSHGTTMDEDMTIPMFFLGKDFIQGRELKDVSVLDLAPTIAEIIGVTKAEEWEGKSLIDRE